MPKSIWRPKPKLKTIVTASKQLTAKEVYNDACMSCHASGAAGAPLLGDLEAWNSRMEKGMDVVMTNVINGVNAMPAKGLCMACTDNELRAIVDYMIAQ